MGLVVSAVVAGIAMSTMYGQVNTLLAFVTQVSEVTMKITGWVICVSPVGIFFLVVSQMVEMESLNVLAGKLGLYLCTVAFGILFHGFVVLPAIYFFFTRKNPYVFMAGMGQAIATAFGTASRYIICNWPIHSPWFSKSIESTVIICCVLSNCRIAAQPHYRPAYNAWKWITKWTRTWCDSCCRSARRLTWTERHSTRQSLPYSSLNCVASHWPWATSSQLGEWLQNWIRFKFDLTHIFVFFLCFCAGSITSTAASIGAAGIPQAGLVTLVMVLDTVGLPPEDVSLILAVDWLL